MNLCIRYLFIMTSVLSLHAQEPKAKPPAEPGEWRAPTPMALQNYAETRQKALQAETRGDASEALTAWERVIDRTNCTEAERMEARSHIRALRPSVAPVYTDKSKAMPWNTLALIFKDVTYTWVDKGGRTNTAHKVMTEKDLQQIRKSLNAFGEHVFTLSSGVVSMTVDVHLVETPFAKKSNNASGLCLSPADVKPFVQEQMSKKKYFTILSYAKCDQGTGPDVPKPFTAAMYGRIAEFDNAGYMVVPWSTNYPYPGETDGEMETHEWLHQLYDVVQKNLGYPKDVMRSSDDGRGEGDTRATGEVEYRRPKGVTTWIHFYEHLMRDHITRQMWTEMTTDPNPTTRPGNLFKKNN